MITMNKISLNLFCFAWLSAQNLDQQIQTKTTRIQVLQIQSEMETNFRAKIRAKKQINIEQESLYLQHFSTLQATEKEVAHFCQELETKTQSELTKQPQLLESLTKTLQLLTKLYTTISGLWPAKREEKNAHTNL